MTARHLDRGLPELGSPRFAFGRIRSALLYASLLVAGAGVVSIHTGSVAPPIYPFVTGDSAQYLEAARHFRAGEGLVVTPRLQHYDADLVPLRLFPPGYPILIAVVSYLGLPVVSAALWVSRLSWLVVPAATVFCLRRFLGAPVAIVCGLLVVASSGIVGVGPRVMSDATFLMTTLFAFGLLVRSVESRAPQRLILISGLLAGVAYAFRNAGTAVVMACLATLVTAAMTGVLTPRQAFRRGLTWSGGALLGIGPLWIWNISVFGRSQPYTLPPSELGLLVNARGFLANLLMDVTSARFVAAVAWDYRLLLVLVAAVLLGFAVGWRYRWHAWGPEARFTAVLLVLYLAIGSCMVVAAGTIYKWASDPSPPRFAIQYSWTVLALVFALIGAGELRRRSTAWWTTVVLSAALLVSRGTYLVDLVQRERAIRAALATPDDLSVRLERLPERRIDILQGVFARDEEVLELVRRLPADAFIASNFSDVFRIETERRVRPLPLLTKAQWASARALLEDVAVQVPASRPVFIVILPSYDLLARSAGMGWQDVVTSALPSRFAVARRTRTMLLLARSP